MASSCSGAPRRLIGALVVYVDDCLFVESEDPEWKDLMTKIKGFYTWGKHDYYDFALCGVRYHQGHDWSCAPIARTENITKNRGGGVFLRKLFSNACFLTDELNNEFEYANRTRIVAHPDTDRSNNSFVAWVRQIRALRPL